MFSDSEIANAFVSDVQRRKMVDFADVEPPNFGDWADVYAYEQPHPNVNAKREVPNAEIA